MFADAIWGLGIRDWGLAKPEELGSEIEYSVARGNREPGTAMRLRGEEKELKTAGYRAIYDSLALTYDCRSYMIRPWRIFLLMRSLAF